MSNRYDTSGRAEGRYQAGSNDLLLENLLSMTDVDEMEFIEFDALLALQTQLIDEISTDQPISVAMLCDWHRRWLGEIYAWAGNFRSVNLAKGDFHFAVAHLIAGLMAKFESQELRQFTPIDGFDKPRLIKALAITHVEFILIHPFRDGNGRLGRLLMTVMALQAGYPLLEFSHIENNKEAYFSAIQFGMDRHYEPMKVIVANVLANSLAKVE